MLAEGFEAHRTCYDELAQNFFSALCYPNLPDLNLVTPNPTPRACRLAAKLAYANMVAFDLGDFSPMFEQGIADTYYWYLQTRQPSEKLVQKDFYQISLMKTDAYRRHCEPTGPAFGRPDERLREAIQSRSSASGLLRRFAPRNDAPLAMIVIFEI